MCLASGVVVVGVRDQRQETGALDRGRQLALVARLGAGDAARDDLAGLGQVLAQGVEILVVDLLDALGGELAELAAAEKLGHVCAPGRRLGGFGRIGIGVVGTLAVVAVVVAAATLATLGLVALLVLVLHDQRLLGDRLVAAHHQVAQDRVVEAERLDQ